MKKSFLIILSVLFASTSFAIEAPVATPAPKSAVVAPVKVVKAKKAKKVAKAKKVEVAPAIK